MKKLFVMAAVGALMLSACSKDDPAVNSPVNEANAHEVELTFDISVSNGMDTRAGGRELYSQEALQKVNEMKVYIFKGADKGDGTYETPTFLQEITVAGFKADSDMGDENHSYMFSKNLAPGKYTFLAVGADAGKTDAYEALVPVEGTTTRAEMLLKLKGTAQAAEIFSGTEDVEGGIEIKADTKNVKVKIGVHRVVAGVLAYFTNIPYKLPYNGEDKIVRKVAVELVSRGTVANLEDRTKNTQNNTTTDKYIELLAINLSNGTNGWAPSETRNIWERAAQTSPATVKENSALKGAFALPIEAVTGKATMRVTLYDGDNNELRHFYVKCTTDSDITEFNINANHLYALGKKLKDVYTTTPEGGTDPTPTPDPEDKPIDLSEEDVIEVYIYADWTKLHELDIID